MMCEITYFIETYRDGIKKSTQMSAFFYIMQIDLLFFFNNNKFCAFVFVMFDFGTFYIIGAPIE